MSVLDHGLFLLVEETVEKLEASGGELTAELELALTSLAEELPARTEKVHALVSRIRAEKELVLAEEKRLAARKGALTRLDETVDAYMLNLLQAHEKLTGEKVISAGTVRVSLTKNPPKLAAPEDVSKWPEQYTDVVFTSKPLRKEALDALKKGEDLGPDFAIAAATYRVAWR